VAFKRWGDEEPSMASLGGVVETFGPFLIPVAVFVVGAVGYFMLLGLTRLFGPDSAESETDGEGDPPDRE
jgi:hypothetical protein